MTELTDKLAAIGYQALEDYENAVEAFAADPSESLYDQLRKRKERLSEVAFAWNIAKRADKAERFKLLSDWGGNGGGFSGGGASGGW